MCCHLSWCVNIKGWKMLFNEIKKTQVFAVTFRAEISQAERDAINKYKLEAWPGYSVQTMLCTQGIFMNFDCCTKFVNQTTIYEIIKKQS